ncbi:MAG TPA: DUF4198 domain-containing protein [Gemmatimonadales bacterium]|nr:DUF4198 domain-containing protein [Gemmatimonadales bacterium]
MSKTGLDARRAALVAGTLLLVASLASAHDLFLKLDSYFLEPRARVRIPVLKGTFAKSESAVAPDRIADISVLSPEGRTHLSPATAWSRGPDSTSLLSLALGDAGTYVVGVSTRPREIELAAREFNAYLEEDGLPDVLEARRRDNELGRDARERYSKHIKAVFQVGPARSGDFNTTLGYPAEIVPLDNPYALAPGTTLRVRCLVDGRPVRNQTVLWGGEGHVALPSRSTQTDGDGVAQITPDTPGKWYVKFIHMVRRTEPALDYESKWATLTFELR